MKALIVVGLFVLAAGITLFAMGVFTPGPEPAPPDVQPPPDGTTGANGATLAAAEPADEPAPELPRLDRPLRILLLTRHRDRFNVFMEQAWQGQPLIQYRAWVQTLRPGETAGASKGETPFAEAPGPEALEDVDVVILHLLDPAQVPAPFFAALAARVQERKTGLLLMPGDPGGAILDVPALKPVLPIAAAKAIQGQPLPGISRDEAPFYVTPAGAAHPSTRIVPFKGWSERIWTRLRTGEKAWGTKFVYPVSEVKPGAEVLLEVDVPRQGRIAAIVQGPPADGRVLWVGIRDFGEAFWRDPKASGMAAALAFQWVYWLSGR